MTIQPRRAYRESHTAIALLQQRWPAAFPQAPQRVRPLMAGLTPLIAAALNGSHPYTRAVLRTWKLRPAYCRAVLDHPVRFDLDGNPTEQSVGEDARTMQRLALPPGPANAASPHRTSRPAWPIDGSRGAQDFERSRGR